MGLLDEHMGTYRSKPLFLMYLLPVLIPSFYLAAFPNTRYIGGTLARLFWAVLWGAVAAISIAIFAFGSPADMRIGNIGRGASAVMFGLSTGIIIFFLMLFSLQIH
jgi:hypothetical protein